MYTHYHEFSDTHFERWTGLGSNPFLAYGFRTGETTPSAHFWGTRRGNAACGNPWCSYSRVEHLKLSKTAADRCLTPHMIDSLKIIPDLCLSFTSVNQIWRGRTKSPSTLASVVPILKKGSTALQRISLVLTCFIRMKGLKLTSRRISHRLRLLRLSYEVPAKKKFYPLDNRQCSNNKYCV